jgi:hypothetical protein
MFAFFCSLLSQCNCGYRILLDSPSSQANELRTIRSAHVFADKIQSTLELSRILKQTGPVAS